MFEDMAQAALDTLMTASGRELLAVFALACLPLLLLASL